jgi:hypothetical protein
LLPNTRTRPITSTYIEVPPSPFPCKNTQSCNRSHYQARSRSGRKRSMPRLAQIRTRDNRGDEKEVEANGLHHELTD